MGTKVKGILIVIFVIPILMVAFAMYMDTYCDMTVKDDSWRIQQEQICEISNQTIDQINSRINFRT